MVFFNNLIFFFKNPFYINKGVEKNSAEITINLIVIISIYICYNCER